MPLEDLSKFSEEEARSVFKETKCYREDDFVSVKDEGDYISISYCSNHLSTPDGESVESIFNLMGVEGGYTHCSFQINKETRERIYGILRIREQHRNQGYGSDLVAAMEKISRSLGTKKIRTHNHRSPGFWRKMGYRYVDGDFEKELG